LSVARNVPRRGRPPRERRPAPNYGSSPAPAASAAHGQMTRRVHPLPQILARLEMRHVLARKRNRIAGLRISPHSRRTIVQREAAEAPYLDTFAARQRLAHQLEDVLDRELHVLGRQVLLIAGDGLDQLGLRHSATASISLGSIEPESALASFTPASSAPSTSRPASCRWTADPSCSS